MKKIIIISGFSGVGKDTLIREVLNKNRDITLVKSCTTRKPRVDDKGKYTYLSPKEFEKLISEKGFLEYNIYGNHYYGTPFKGPEGVNVALEKADTILLEVDYNGMKKICENKYFDKNEYKIITIFIVASSDILINRLLERGTESSKQIKQRLKSALSEVTHIGEYDYTILNDGSIEFAVNDLEEAIQGKEIEELIFFERYFERGIRDYIGKIDDRI